MTSSVNSTAHFISLIEGNQCSASDMGHSLYCGNKYQCHIFLRMYSQHRYKTCFDSKDERKRMALKLFEEFYPIEYLKYHMEKI